jgi:hypothetical protein
VTAERRCKDCGSTTKKLSHPGPRDLACHRLVVKARKAAAHDRYAQVTYGLQPGEYAKLYEAQGGRCALCRRATGAARKLAVDHDHSCCPGPTSCGKCVRGLLCSVCNKKVLGHARDDVAYFRRCIDYLINPPARKILFPFSKG